MNESVTASIYVNVFNIMLKLLVTSKSVLTLVHRPKVISLLLPFSLNPLSARICVA